MRNSIGCSVALAALTARRAAPSFWSGWSVILLCAVLLASHARPYPLTPGDVVSAITARLAGHAAPEPIDTVLFQIRLPRVLAALAGRCRAGGGRRQLPDAVPQPACLAGYPGRVGGRRLRRGAWHPAVAAGDRHPGAGLRDGPSHRRHRLHPGARLAQPERDPRAGAGGHRRRRAGRRRHFAGEGSGRSLQPASRHHLLAARQPVGHQGERPADRGAAGDRGPRAARPAALADRRDVAGRRRSQGARRQRQGRARRGDRGRHPGHGDGGLGFGRHRLDRAGRSRTWRGFWSGRASTACCRRRC